MINLEKLKPILEGIEGLPVETLETIAALDEPMDDVMTKAEVDELLAAKDAEYNDRFRKAFFTEAAGTKETVEAAKEEVNDSNDGDPEEADAPVSFEDLFVEEKKED